MDPSVPASAGGAQLVGRPKGRRPGSADTRGRLLVEARATFAERGFEGTTIREVAARSGVDPALVHHYFGSKQQLFLSAMEFPIDVAAVLPAVVDGPRDTIGERVVRTFVAVWDRPEVTAVALGLVRSAATDTVAAGMLRRILVEGPLSALSAVLSAPDGGLRATLAGTQLVGLAMARYVVRLEPIASLSPDALAALVGPTITRYLVGDLGSGVLGSGDPDPARGRLVR